MSDVGCQNERMANYHLAQMNVARMMFPVDDPRMAEFAAAIRGVNALADQAPGFVWRLPSYLDDTDAIRVSGSDMLLVNMSVWADVESLKTFTYKNPEHFAVFRRRREWFDRLDVPHLALWWLPQGEVPSIGEGERRLNILAENGPGPDAFTFAAVQPPPLPPP
jgi:hypothetical protein